VTETTLVTAGLPPITLDELVEHASLMTRVDHKYILPTAELPELLVALADEARILETGGARDFAYWSVYFDTPRMDAYLGAAHRRRRRFKVRIRRYMDSDRHFIEVKRPGCRDVTVKERIPYSGADHELDAEAEAFVDRVLSGAGVDCSGARLVPSLTTHYRRTTLYIPSTGGRVTLDADLTWGLPDGTTRHLPDRVIVETKSDRAASPVDRLLWSLGHRPHPVSKYCTGLALLRPELPANRWHAVLRRHFPATVPR
jgi:hypothetical protein